jgi:hypothetical protein
MWGRGPAQLIQIYLKKKNIPSTVPAFQAVGLKVLSSEMDLAKLGSFDRSSLKREAERYF